MIYSSSLHEFSKLQGLQAQKIHLEKCSNLGHKAIQISSLN